MAVYAAPESNLEGAPSSPLNVEPTVGEVEAKTLQRIRELIAAGMHPDEARRVAYAQTGLGDAYSRDMQRQFEEGRNRPPDEEEMALRASMRPAPLDMSSTDTLPGDQPGTMRVWNQRTRQYDTVRKPTAPVAPKPDPTLGSPVGSGPAFSTEAERDRYNARPKYTGEQEQAMRDAGATWAEIAEARMSPRDRDMMGVGQSGYAPVYSPSGGVTYLPRAPGAGTANAATDGRMVGKEVDNRDRNPSLQRPDLEARGYVPTMVDGPNGPEMVYMLTPEKLKANRELGQQQSNARMMSRLRDAAGITNPTEEDLALTADQLRERGRAKKLADRQAKELQWRAQVMMRAGNRAGALALPGLDDWQRSVIAGGPTPLGVEAARAARRDGGDDARLAAIQAQMETAAADREQRRQEFEQSMNDREAEREQRRDDSQAEHTRRLEEFRAANARAMAELRARDDATRMEWDTRARMNTENAGVERAKAEAAEKLKADEARRNEEMLRKKEHERTVIAPLEAQHGAGIRHIIAGNYETPEAQASMESMAAASDQSWTGFYNSDALRLDATLQRLGITDPSVRLRLVNQYGLGPMAAFGPGGRSGPISGIVNWMYGAPSYTQVPSPGS
jgi:hypothetical protein